MVLRSKTLSVDVPRDGTPVPLLMQTSPYPFVIRPDGDVRIGSQDSLNSNTGLLLVAGSVFGMGKADFGDIGLYSQLYVCAANPGAGRSIQVRGICWEVCRCFILSRRAALCAVLTFRKL